MKLLRSILLVALLGAACGKNLGANVVAYAAIVNGESISASSLQDELDAIGSNDQYVGAIESNGVSVRGTGAGTFDAGFTAQVLTRMVAFELVGQEMAERDLELTDDARTAARSDVEAQLEFTGGDGQVVAGKDVFAAFPASFQDLLVDRTAMITVLQESLTRSAYEEHPEQFDQVCTHHILLDTKKQALTIRDRIVEGGEKFETIAKAKSTDTGSGAQGGDLGCTGRGQFVPEFEAVAFELAVGEISPPVQTQFGFHLIRVDSRARTPIDDVLADQQTQQTSFQDWITKALTDATVEVNERYGTWDTSVQPMVSPPSVPTTLAPKGATTTLPEGLLPTP